MEDIDYTFLKIRAKSNGDNVFASYKCIKKNEEDKECGTNIKVLIDLNRVETYYPEDYEKNRIIMTGENSGIKFSNPTLEAFKLIKKEIDGTESLFDITESYIYACVECTFDGDEVSTPDVDFNETEFREYLNELDGSVIDRINTFFNDMPYTGMELNVTCPKCRNKEQFILRNLEDFFV
jgi:hypothetical protein